jgi:hypothetical protein
LCDFRVQDIVIYVFISGINSSPKVWNAIYYSSFKCDSTRQEMIKLLDVYPFKILLGL